MLVLGKQPLSNGTLPEQFIAQINAGVAHLESNPFAHLIISGGKTLPDYPSEAEMALKYIPEKLYPRVHLEYCSLSTKQNIVNVRDICEKADYLIKTLIVISSPAHQMQTTYLIKRYWNEIVKKYHYQSAGQSNVSEWFTRGVIYLMQIIDPEEQFFLPLKRRLIAG